MQPNQANEQLFRPFSSPKRPKIWRRLGLASLVVLVLHVFFFSVVAPYLKLESDRGQRTEVVQITPQELARLKKKILNDKYLSPLLEQELRKEFQTKEPPKDARMMAPFNQTVPREKVAGPQPDAPLKGGGTPKAQQQPQQKLDLSKLGLGSKLPPPPKPQTYAGPEGPPSPHRPVGRDDKSLERADENMLNAIESEYYSFFSRLEEPIIRNWYFLLRSNDHKIREEMVARKVRAGSELPVTIEFVLDREGNFKSIDVIESSGVPSLDWATRESVRKLGSLPNPPPGLFEGGQYFTRRLKFMVHVSEAPFINARPDIYW
ncbi:MAG: TonB family protein [Bdellovibrionota bacterium]